jgi:hypothetical protein
MNTVDSVRVPVIAEWIDDKLSLRCLHFAARLPSASWRGKSK